MKKIIWALTLFILISASLFAGGSAEDIENETRRNALVACYPYDGSFDVNLRDGNYPVRTEGSNISFNEANGKPVQGAGNNPSEYYDFQMIAHAILEGVSLSYSTCYVESLENFDMIVTVDCPSDFMFVSQSDPSYKRPFVLYAIPNGAVGDRLAVGNESVTPYLIDDSASIPLDFPVNTTDGDYATFWVDFLLALPGEVDDNGVLYDNVYYPLSDATDYTAEVTITVEWKLDKVPASDGDTVNLSFEKTFTVPFSGYCSFSAPEESVGSLYISTTAESQNINLNPDYVAPVKVADISYLLNLGHGKSSEFIPVGNNEDRKAWMFFSASPDPWSNLENNHFRMYHVEAGSNTDEYNSVPFMVYVEDTDGTNQYVEFTGNAKAGDFSPVVGGTSADFIRTKCNYGQSRSEGGTFLRPIEAQYYHYHSFDGEVWVEVTPEVDIMAAGRYVGDIYVHVIAEDV